MIKNVSKSQIFFRVAGYFKSIGTKEKYTVFFLTFELKICLKKMFQEFGCFRVSGHSKSIGTQEK